MQRIFKSFGLMLALATMIAPVPAGAQVAARIWVDAAPDYFRQGDRMNVNFSVSDDSYVAIVHIDTDGYLDFVFPASPWDNEFVRRGVTHSIRARGAAGAWTVRGRPGIGYFYIIASPTPLDFSYFRGRTGSPWEWGYAGQTVRGDPFFALDQIARLLLSPSPYARYASDYYSYYVDGIHQYPSYACSNQYYEYGWGLYPSYSSCTSQAYFLRENPYYYDTRRYRGDRRQVLGRYGTIDPRYGYKADPAAAPRATPGGASPSLQGSGGQIPRRDAVPQAAPPPSTTRQPAQGRAPAQGRTGQAQPSQPSGGAGSSSTGARERPTPSSSSGQPASSAGPSQRPAATSGGGGSAPARGRPAID